MRNVIRVAPVVVVTWAAFALAACGSDSNEETEAVRGQLEALPSAPASDKAVAGEATLQRVEGRTTVSLRATGLEPGTEYVAHLHTGGCDQADPGGPHFQFDAEGGDEPPSEIHLEFRSGADGSGKATTSTNREVPAGEAGSVVIHEAGGEQAKIACAELEGGHAHDSAGEESASRGGEVPTIVVRNGEPVGGVAELEYSAGDDVRFEVNSDVADEVHVHGYDLLQEVPAGGTVSFDFPAEIEGIFEVELEGRKTQIAGLTVNP